jgi:O-antigen/teichoic acid export membrane protein
VHKTTKTKTILGIFWNFSEKIFVQGSSFIINIILARLLSPDDYGIIGMVMIFLAISQVFVDSGFSRALVQRQNRTENDFSTAFLFNSIISIIIYAVLYIAAPAIASFYNTEILVRLTRILFLVIIFNSLSVVQNARLMIAVDFKRIAQINFVAVFISGIVSIIAAYKNCGVWSLVLLSLVRSIVTALLYWIYGKWYPKQRISIQSFMVLFNFGSKLLISGLLATIFNHINTIVIGKFYQQRQLGFYTRARQFGELTSGTITSVIQAVTFPLLSALQNEPKEMIRIYRKLLKYTALFILPIMTGIALLSKQIIIVLLTEKWLPSSELLFWTAFTFLFTPISTLNMNMLNAIGRSDLFLKLDMSKLPITMTIMVVTLCISIKAVVVGSFISSFICFFINAYLPGKLFHYGPFKQIKDVGNIIISTSVMALFLFFWVNLDILKSNILILIIGIIIGMFIYFFCLYIFKEEDIKVLISLFGNGMKALKSKNN